jgi:hypothetical protein
MDAVSVKWKDRYAFVAFIFGGKPSYGIVQPKKEFDPRVATPAAMRVNSNPVTYSGSA